MSFVQISHKNMTKNMLANFWRPFGVVIIIPLYSFQIESDKVGEGGAKIQRIEYLENEKSLCSSLFFKSFILVKQKEK